MGCTPAEQLERMGQDVDHRFERLDGPFGRPRDIEHEALTHSTCEDRATGVRGGSRRAWLQPCRVPRAR